MMQEQIRVLLKSLVEINSVYPNETEYIDWLVNYFEHKKYKVLRQKVEKGRENLIIQKGDFDKFITFYAHADTVEIVDGWTHEPLKLTVKGSKAFGLGAYDMKAGLVANIITFLESNPKSIGLQLIICIDEENISKGAHKLTSSNLLQSTKCILSPEPAFRLDQQGITIGRPGRAVFEIKLEQPSRHYVFYKKENDLQLLASRIIEKLSKFNQDLSEEKRQFLFVRRHESQTSGMSLPDKVIMEVDSCIIPPNSNQKILEEIKILVDKEAQRFSSEINTKIGFRQRETPFLSSYELEPNDIPLGFMKYAIRNVTGKEATPYFRSSIADENIFGSLGYSVLGIGPSGGNAHAPDEWVDLKSIENLINIYKEFVNLYDKSLDADL